MGPEGSVSCGHACREPLWEVPTREPALLPAPRPLAKYAHGPAVAQGGRALLPKENPGSSEHRGLCLLQRSLQRVEEGHRAHLQKGRREEEEL